MSDGVLTDPASIVTRNIIGGIKPDTPIYRVFKRKWLLYILREREMALMPPGTWDDPFEDLLSKCAITYPRSIPVRQEFFDQVRRPLYGQCWSLLRESDAIWRIYSTVEKHPTTARNQCPEWEGIAVRTTVGKLIAALWGRFPTVAPEACFIGEVGYLPEKSLKQWVADVVGRDLIAAFDSGPSHARTLLAKRDSFSHEREVRLIFVSERSATPPPRIIVPVVPNDLFDEVILDPRLSRNDVNDRIAELRGLGYSGRIERSDLYQMTFLEIPVDAP